MDIRKFLMAGALSTGVLVCETGFIFSTDYIK